MHSSSIPREDHGPTAKKKPRELCSIFLKKKGTSANRRQKKKSSLEQINDNFANLAENKCEQSMQERKWDRHHPPSYHSQGKGSDNAMIVDGDSMVHKERNRRMRKNSIDTPPENDEE